MKKAVTVLTIYLFSLLLFSVLLNWLGFNASFLQVGKIKALSPMMLATVAGGVVSLYFTVSTKSLKMFLWVYTFLWLIRIAMLYIANYIGTVTMFGKLFRFDIIIPNYYENISRIGTPLPFVIFWFINYLFISDGIKLNKVKNGND